MKHNISRFTLIILLMTIMLSGCRKKDTSPVITIAEQYGLAYAPLQVMKEKGFLEKKIP